MDGVASLIFIGCCLFIPMILIHLDRPKAVEVIRYQTIFVKPSKDKIVYETEQSKNFTTDLQEPAKKTNLLIFNDCIEVLVSLGMKRNLAKEKATQLLNTKHYNSIESFLMDAYKV